MDLIVSLPVIAVLLYVFFEVNYVLRIICYGIWASIFTLRKKFKKIEDEGVVYGICCTTDLDVLLHMSNSRYLREMDFSRIDFYVQNGVYNAIRQTGGCAVQAACSIRFRKPVTLFQVFRIRSKFLYWDDRNAYIEQRMETVHDNMVRAIMISKQTAIRTDMNRVFLYLFGRIPKPPDDLPDDLRKWIESNECSSQRLRANILEEAADTDGSAKVVDVQELGAHVQVKDSNYLDDGHAFPASAQSLKMD